MRTTQKEIRLARRHRERERGLDVPFPGDGLNDDELAPDLWALAGHESPPAIALKRPESDFSAAPAVDIG